MDIVINFKNHLLIQKQKPSKLTIKNYLSDVRKFIQWYENNFNATFAPAYLSSQVISQYSSYLLSGSESSLPAARSTKRYLSSLRKFCGFLEESGAINANPFPKNITPQAVVDPFYLKEFKNFLFTEHARKLTIKNYMADVNQFIQWLERVVEKDPEANFSNPLHSVDNSVLEQYKQRLLTEAQLSPVSINRKLSSLRRYTNWLEEKGVLTNQIIKQAVEEVVETEKPIMTAEPIIPDLPLIALQGLAEEEEKKEKTHQYSSFGPLRMIQRTSRFISLGTELLFFNPITNVVEAIHYSLWKNGKKQIFTPVTTILESSSYIPKGVSIKTIIPKASSMQPPKTANLASVKNILRNLQPHTQQDDILHNFPKGLYAPLKISTKHMRLKDKIWHHIRYSRPDWYIKYHEWKFVHYLHFAILILGTMIASAAVYQSWSSGNPKQNEAVLAAQDTAPPRTLSFQGKLLDKNDVPLTAETPLRFALYNSPTASGAGLLWQEKQEIIPDQNGNFTATLGKIERIPQSLFTNNPSLYIGVTVGDNPELSPRQQIPTTEYATDSQSVEGLKPITDSSTLAQNVLLALDSSGNLTIGGTQSHTFQATGSQLTLSGQTLLLTTNSGSNGDIQIAPNGSGNIDLNGPIQNTSNYSMSGAAPGSVIVKDILSVLATSSSQSALVISQNGSGDIISGQSNGTDKFRLDNQGDEFLAGDLIINGDTIGTTSTVFDIAGTNVNTLNIGNNARTISLGASSGITTINNSLAVSGTTDFTSAVNAFGLISANAGITIAAGQKLTLPDFTPNGIPFINSSNQLVQDAGSFSWDDTNKALNVFGSICIQNTAATCSGSTPGTIYAANTTVQSADLAENYISSQTLEPGDVVMPANDGNNQAVIETTSAYQPQVIGIISTNPGVTLNSGAQTDDQHPHVYPLALQGRVPVNVSSINGTIQAGDNLTSSSIPGVAMKATDSGQIIGKALESYSNSDPNAVGKIMVFVNLSYQSNPTTITSNGDLASTSESANLVSSTTDNGQSLLNNDLTDITGNIQLGALKVQSLTTQTLEITTDNIMVGGQTLKDYITGLVEQLVNEELDKRLAHLHNQPSVTNPIASNSANTADQTTSITVTPTPIASSSSDLYVANSEPTQPASPSSTPVPTIYNSIASSSAEASLSATLTPAEEDEIPSATDSSTQTDTDIQNQPGINSITPQNSVSNNYEPAASLSGQLTYVPNFKSDFQTVTEGLVALGPTSLTDVSISDQLTVNNNLKITQNSIDTMNSDLNIQPLRQGNILFMGGLVAIDTQGNLQVNGNATFAQNVNVDGQLAAGIIAPIPNQDLVINLTNKSDNTGSSLVVTNATGSAVLSINQSGDISSSGEATFDTVASHGFSIIRGVQADTSMTETTADSTAGTGVITAYETERTIFTPYITKNSLIYITPTSDTGNVTPYLARQTLEDPSNGTQGSFTVAIPASLTTDTTFNWWIVN